MTTQPPQHCDHEFVCRFYVDNGPCIQPDILSSVCEHDSRRSRPAHSPSELAATAYQAGIECGREEGAAQAREDAMVEIVEELHRQFIGRTKSQILDIMCECQINPGKWLKSLRTGGERR